MTTTAHTTARTKQVYCRGCGRTAVIPAPAANGHPYGWYTLSVSVPPEVGTAGKPYIWIGLFCCVGCLIGHESDLAEDAMLTEGLYERE